MIQDLHSHTYYSFCGGDNPEVTVKAAIDGGIELFGITDHNYGIGLSKFSVYQSKNKDLFNDYERTLKRYYDHISLIKQKYSKRINVLCGIEIATEKLNEQVLLPANADISFFDYCLVEHISDLKNSAIKGDIMGFAERCGCLTGIAHTDMFDFVKTIGETPKTYFKKLAERDIFWEINVNFDSIHNYREHDYVIEFFNNKEQQQIIKNSGIKLSVGFDGHKVQDYRADRVIEACKRIAEMGIPMVFE